MALPEFDQRGLLPAFVGNDATTHDRSPYFCTMSDLCASLGTTDRRRQLLKSLISYRALIGSDDYVNGVQFIDGSFVENVEMIEERPPNDIDVFSMLVPPAKYQNSSANWTTQGLPFWQSEIADNARNKARFSVDCYALMLDVQSPSAFLRQALYWYGLFSHKRKTYEWKGFVAVPLNATNDQFALATIGRP